MSDEPEDDGPRRLPFDSPLLDASALRALLRRRERDAIPLGLGLALAGWVTPDALASYLAEMAGIDVVPSAELDALSRTSLAGFPEELIFDGACLPLGRTAEGRVVAMADPTAPGLLRETQLFAASDVVPVILPVDLLAVHYHRIFGRYWRVRTDHEWGGVGPGDETTRLLDQIQSLEIELAEGTYEDAKDLIVVHLGPDGAVTELPLTRSRRTAAATLDRATEPVLTQAERPRIRGKTAGSSRHYLDPTQEGEAVVVTESRKEVVEDGPSIIIDSALLAEAEAEPEPAEQAGSGSIILDPSLFNAEAEAPKPEPPVRKVAVPTQIRLGQLKKPRESLHDKDLGVDIDVLVETGEFDIDDLPNDDPSAEWSALDVELDALDDELSEFDRDFADLLDYADELDWPFETESTNGADNPFSRTPSQTETRRVGGIRTGPIAGEASIVKPGPKPGVDEVWFDPRTEGASGARVPDDLKSQLRALREADSFETTFCEMARVITRVYARSAVFRLELGSAVVLAHDSDRSPGKFVNPGNAPVVAPDELPILDRLSLMHDQAYLGRLSTAAGNLLHNVLPGGPSLSGAICPVALGGRVVLLLYGDHGPGREARREPEMWRLMLREAPRALLRLNTLRKRRYRWETKFIT